MAFKRVTARVDFDAIAHNYKVIKNNLPANTKIMGIIKADAYGHGALPVARELEHLKIDMFGVATIQEAISLRKNGIKNPMLILGFTGAEDYSDLIEFDLSQTIYEKEMAIQLNKAAAAVGKKAKIHIKVDTGMGRLGFGLDMKSVADVVELATLKELEVEGIFTHFSKADEENVDYTRQQLQAFRKFIDILSENGIYPKHIHAANSAGIINHPSAHFNMVRAGIILYGSYPSDFSHKVDFPLKPALSVCSKVIFLKTVAAGQKISYGGIYQTEKETKIATVSIGYADGYSRLLSNRGRVLIHGQYAQVIGRVCMDQLMVDVTEIEEVAIGDEVVLFGEQNGKNILIEEVAELSNTINYEVMCLIGKRVPREYYKSGQYQFEIDYFDILETGLHIG
ncbi:alanine racemase [Clostridiales bacterium COT073_COT-073]|nr:alanine racemase [Clostridiales bacterium COT073_COT-073]